MSKIYRCILEVRGYELDSFGHVNHAVYIQYLEHARWKMLEEEGITSASFDEWKRWPVISSVEAQYLRPSFLGQKLEVKTQLVEHGKTFLCFDHEIERDGQPIFRGQIKLVTVNDQGRPALLPPELGCLWADASPHSSGDSSRNSSGDL